MGARRRGGEAGREIKREELERGRKKTKQEETEEEADKTERRGERETAC